MTDDVSGFSIAGQTYGTFLPVLGRTALYVNAPIDGSSNGVFVTPPDEGGYYRIGFQRGPAELPKWPWNEDMEVCRPAIPLAYLYTPPWEDPPPE